MSTKSGLDPGGVWQAWAMASLKAGNLSGAREKFGRCLRVPVDRNQLSLGAPLLQEIVQHLEMIVRPTLATVGGRCPGGALVLCYSPYRSKGCVCAGHHHVPFSVIINPVYVQIDDLLKFLCAASALIKPSLNINSDI